MKHLERLFQDYEGEFGHGWKKRLADDLGVHPTNIQSWIKSGTASASAIFAAKLLIECRELKKEAKLLRVLNKKAPFFIVKDVSCENEKYSIAVQENGILTLVATGISDKQKAFKMGKGAYSGIFEKIEKLEHEYLELKDNQLIDLSLYDVFESRLQAVFSETK